MTKLESNTWTLRDFLNLPYVVVSEVAEVASGVWVRRVSYPELPDCSAEAEVVEDALRLLERRRIQTIVRMLREGEEPPRPRAPLTNCDPAWASNETGLNEIPEQMLDRPSAEMRGAPDPFLPTMQDTHQSLTGGSDAQPRK
jgi:hypothetical protein